VLQFFLLLRDESNTQSSGDGVNHRSFKIDILQNLGGKTRDEMTRYDGYCR
jgi:hypothetical protein